VITSILVPVPIFEPLSFDNGIFFLSVGDISDISASSYKHDYFASAMSVPVSFLDFGSILFRTRNLIISR
jgi:hypothetical protein